MTAAMETGSSNRPPIDRLLRPRSVAIVGASPAATSFGASVFLNLQNAKFGGDLYLVNPKRSEIHGRPCLPSIESLPFGVDCAVLAIPRSSVLEAVAACACRGVGAVIVFSSGFAEGGPQGRDEQEEISAIAKKHGMIVEGPNCLGMVNFIDGIPLTFVLTPPAIYAGDNGVAVISQSGAMAAVVGVGLRHRELGVSFSVSTGNEAVSFVEDFVEYLIEDCHTKVLLMIVEKFRHPQKFLALAAHARKLGKFIVLLHPGRSSAARASAETHTGAMAGDYKVMHTTVTHAGVVVVETLEELLDVSEMLLRFPSLPLGGTAVLTESGAFKALSLDFCERVGLPLPGLSEVTSTALRCVLPDFIPPTNPLDLTAQGLVDPDLYRRTLPPILADERFGSLVLAIILTDEPTSGLKFPPVIDAIREAKSSKPIVFAGLDEGAKIPPEYIDELRALGVPFFPTPERAFRALACVTSFSCAEARLRSKDLKEPHSQDFRVSNLGSGVIPEYRSKEVLNSLGIRIPEGTLARTEAEAKVAAARLGYPVALKAQSARLSHKSDDGGVALNLNDGDELGEAWFRIRDSVSRAYPELVLDGMLVEKMGARGIELIVGVRNDPDWGPVILIGIGGVFAEALNDVRLIPPDLPVEVIMDEILQLKCASLLSGFRGSQPIDIEAVADVVHRLGVFALANPEVKEVDVNPLVAYENDRGALALDALIVTRQSASCGGR